MNPRTLAPYVLRDIARYQAKGRLANLQTLVEDLKVRRADVRRTISALHREGYVDALRMRLTLKGFALGAQLASMDLPPLREVQRQTAAA